MNVDIVRKELAKSLGLPENSGHDLISNAILKGRNQSLKDLEENYLRELENYFGVKDEVSWSKIVEAYLSSIEKQLEYLDQVGENKKEFLAHELRRLQIAKILQLNKFTASFSDIWKELENLGVNIDKIYAES